MIRKVCIRSLLCGVAFALPYAAQAEEPVVLTVAYVGDTAATISGGSDSKARYLGNLDMVADADLDALIGLEDMRFHAHALHNHGARPNDSAGTLQGVDNIEVGRPDLRLFEAWVEKRFGANSLRLGLYDLNSEFYTTESAGLLIQPSFGIGSELAASGPNGPSIFPSTALGARLNLALGKGGYARIAAVNARASTLGDTGGVDFSFRDGVLVIGEAGKALMPGLTASAGSWIYSRARDDVYETDASGAPLRHTTWGGYAAMEITLSGNSGHGLQFFLRGGFSEGRTTPYAHGVQAGMLLSPALRERSESSLSIGVQRAVINGAYRNFMALQGDVPAGHESAIELTYADKLFPFLTVQPDLQAIFRPGGRANSPVALVATLRLSFEFSTARD